MESRDELQDALADSNEAVIQGLNKFNIGPEEFREVVSIWNKASDTLVEGGGEALYTFVEENLDTFVIHRGRPGRGTEPHSPLPWWKYVIVATYIGVAVFAVAACFMWSACTWVWIAIFATAPWTFQIIDRGC